MDKSKLTKGPIQSLTFDVRADWKMGLTLLGSIPDSPGSDLDLELVPEYHNLGLGHRFDNMVRNLVQL